MSTHLAPKKVLDEPIVGFIDEERFLKKDGSVWKFSGAWIV